MIVVDASALIAVLLNEDEHHSIALLMAGGDRLVIAAPTKFEFLLVAERRYPGLGSAGASELLATYGIETVDWTDAHADAALEAFLRFGKGRHPARLNFGDCMAYALAKSLGAPLLHKGADFAATDIEPAFTVPLGDHA